MGSVEPKNPRAGESSANQQRDAFTIGGISVQVSGTHGADVTLVPSLQPFRSRPQCPDIHLQIEWTGNLFPLGGEAFVLFWFRLAAKRTRRRILVRFQCSNARNLSHTSGFSSIGNFGRPDS